MRLPKILYRLFAAATVLVVSSAVAQQQDSQLPATTLSAANAQHDCSPYAATEAYGDLSSAWTKQNQKNHRLFTVPNEPGGGYVTVTLIAHHPDVTPAMSLRVASKTGQVINGGGAGRGNQTITDVFEAAGGETYFVEVVPAWNAPIEDHPVSYSLSWKYVSLVDCYEPNDAEQKRWETVLPVAKAIPLNQVIEASDIVGYGKTSMNTARRFDWYKFTLNEPRTITIRTLQVADDAQAGLRLFNEQGRYVTDAPKPAIGATTESKPKLLEAGTYYLEWIPAKRGKSVARTSNGVEFPNHFVRPYRIVVTDGTGGPLVAAAPSPSNDIYETPDPTTIPSLPGGELPSGETDSSTSDLAFPSDPLSPAGRDTLQDAHDENAAPDITYGSEKEAQAAACDSAAECAAGSYCAIDNTCHPDNHAPRPKASGGLTIEAWNEQQRERNALIGDLDYEPAPDLQAGDGTESDGLSVEEWNEQQNARNADRFGDLDHLSTIDPLTAARSASASDTSDQDPGTQDTSSLTEEDGMTVSDYLGRINFDRAPSGDVRACSSFAEVVRDTATRFRDKVTEIAATNACRLMTTKLRDSATGQQFTGTGESYRTTSFATKLITETYENCVAAATATSELPDSMISFWNNNVASWATIGPRSLQFRKTHSGKLISPGDRKFITPGPAIGQNTTFLVLKELEGKARVNSRICTVSLFNEYRLLHDYTINATAESRRNQDQYFSYDLTGIQGKYIIVKLNAAGRFLRHFKYTLSID